MAKLKRGTEHLLEGKTPVWVERDLENGLVLVCDSIRRGVGDNFSTVGIDTLLPKNNRSKALFLRPKPLTEKQKSDKEQLREFYKSLPVPFNCEECGKPLYAYGEFAKRCVSAHILPKNSFESVKMCPENIVYLGCDLVAGICNCHGYYDATVENRVKMKVYPQVLKQFDGFKHLLTDKEMVDALDYLGIT